MDAGFRNAIEQLRSAVSALEPGRLDAAEAQELVDLLAQGERLCQAGRALAARRVLELRAWRASGYRTPAQWMASRTGTTLSQAITAVETAHRITAFPATREAFVAGRLSETQAAEITAAAAADRSSEHDLLEMAAKESVSTLRGRCREVRAAAASDEEALERIRRGRYLRNWIDRDGAVRFDARLAPDDGARVLAAVTATAAALQREAHRSGQREPAEAYAADALVRLTRGTEPPRTVVHVHVDRAALERGRVEPGETCTIDGVGPVPVAAARRLAADGVIKALVADRADVRAVAHLGRSIPARIRTALEARDRTCVVPGCDVRSGLEIDHIVPLALGGPTSLENLVRLCRYHHAQKTHRGWRLEGRPGSWAWVKGAGRAAARPEPRDPHPRDPHPRDPHQRDPHPHDPHPRDPHPRGPALPGPDPPAPDP